jgi:hypothetical protein
VEGGLQGDPNARQREGEHAQTDEGELAKLENANVCLTEQHKTERSIFLHTKIYILPTVVRFGDYPQRNETEIKKIFYGH